MVQILKRSRIQESYTGNLIFNLLLARNCKLEITVFKSATLEEICTILIVTGENGKGTGNNGTIFLNQDRKGG